MSFLQALTRPKYLLVVFIVTLAMTSVIKMPASLLRTVSGQTGVKYNSASGTVWRGRLVGVSYGGQYFDHLDYSLKLKSIFLADLYGSFTLVGATETIKGQIAGRTAGAWNFPQIEAITEIVFHSGNMSQKATLSFKGQDMVINDVKGCETGQMQVQSRFETGLVAALVGDSVMMTGEGLCHNGAVQINMSSDNPSLPLSLTARIDASGMKGTLRLRKTAIINQNIAIRNMLKQNGFKELNEYWVSDIR